MVHSVSVSRKLDFLHALSKTQIPRNSIADLEMVKKETENTKSGIGDQKTCTSIPRNAAKREQRYSHKYSECHVLKESEVSNNNSETFMNELRNKLAKQDA